MAQGVLSLNDRAMNLANTFAQREGELAVAVHQVNGATVIDAGVNQVGSITAGLLIARICMADLGHVEIEPGQIQGFTNPRIAVNVNHPVAACMASQYAGWQLTVDKYFAMGSGPMRAARGNEKLFNHINMREKPNCAVGVLETSKLPDEAVVKHIADACGVNTKRLTLIVARTASLAGGVQVVARSVETAMHKLHELGFDLSRVVGGFGDAPLPPVAGDDLAAIGRTNDAMLYGAQVVLYVVGDDASLANVTEKLPSSSSKDYGEPFATIFKRYDHDFYKIDPMLFSPAAVCLQNIQTGRSHRAGQVNDTVLTQSFFS